MAKKKVDNIFNMALVEKRNVLNEIHKNNMSLQELRFFSIYLSKINARDVKTRVVKFSLDDFRKIMELGADMNITHFRLVIRHLLQQIVEVPNESGYGYTAFQLFKECTLDKDEWGQWYVTIDAHDKALPLLFDFKNKYFTYELWNALKLKSSNQIRMYEILKQYETIGKREISVVELRELLGISSNEYPRLNNFKTRVLDSCQQALAENTDITYTYEKGKSGKGGKWLTIVFYIKKNKKHIDQLSLKNFIEQQIENTQEDTQQEIEYGGELANLLGSSACNDEFTVKQIRVIQDLILKLMPYNDNIARCDYLGHKINIMNEISNNTPIINRYNYLRKMIENDITDNID